MASLYPASETQFSPKCQCVTFNSAGRILGSCDSLFSVSGMGPDLTEKSFPFLKTVAESLKKSITEGEPVFYPNLDFRFGAYHSICDFTFMKSTDAHGREHFIWMIYDNSTHYRMLISKPEVRKSTGRRRDHQERISATVFKAG